jgi:hypothetical protein
MARFVKLWPIVCKLVLDTECNPCYTVIKVEAHEREDRTMIVSTWTNEEYAEIKQAIKDELEFKVNVRRMNGTLDIYPTKADGYNWTPEQTEIVYEFMQQRGMISGSCQVARDKVAMVFSDGFHYVRKVR